MGRPKIIGALGKQLKPLAADITATADNIEAKRNHAALIVQLEGTKAEKKARLSRNRALDVEDQIERAKGQKKRG